MASKTQLAVGLDAGSSRTRCIDLRARRRSHPLSGARPGARRGMGEGPRHRSGRAGRIDSRRGDRCRARRAGIGRSGHRRASAAWASCGAQSRGLYEFGRPREVDAEDMAYAVEARRGSSPGARPHAAARPAAGLHARRTRRLSQAAQRRVLAPGSQRPHRHRVVSGASGGGRGGASGRPRRRGNGVRADGRRLRLPVIRRSARAAWRCSTWACIRRTWWSTMATRCCSPPAFRSGPII